MVFVYTITYQHNFGNDFCLDLPLFETEADVGSEWTQSW